jgi:shikimate kinase
LGPKHSGKTSTGRELARRLNRSFYDLDEFIEKRTGQSPRTLFIAGPEVFRRQEAEALEVLLEKEDSGILAAGGGIIDNPPAMDLLRRNKHMTVYLEVSAGTAWRRIDQQGELPPFLRAANGDSSREESREKHRFLHERRAQAYREFAQICIPAEEKTPLQLAEEILYLCP